MFCQRLIGWHRRTGSEEGPTHEGSRQEKKKYQLHILEGSFTGARPASRSQMTGGLLGTARGRKGTGTPEHGKPGDPVQLPQPSLGEDAAGGRNGWAACWSPGCSEDGGRRRGGGRLQRGARPGKGLRTRLRGSGSATHLSELESRDDGDNDAHEADVEPIPVGEAGIGLSLQELEQHHPGPATPRRQEPAPGRRRLSEPPFTGALGSQPPGRRAWSLRRPTARWAPRRGRRFREPGAHALGAAEADPRPARRRAPPGLASERRRRLRRRRRVASATWRAEGARAGARPAVCACAAGSVLWALPGSPVGPTQFNR